jgi:hypothetical protein
VRAGLDPPSPSPFSKERSIRMRFVDLSVAAALALASSPGSAAADAPGSASACGAGMPAGLAVPAGNDLAFELQAEGVQIYACATAGGGFAWTFQAPEARLLGLGGRADGSHYAGPTWEGSDGSKVVAAKVEGATPDPAAIPWLLLRAASHAGSGRMAEVSFVQRVKTSGGNAPAGGCDAAHSGAVARVPYRAVYCFYRKR